ncbi:AEC family transporter [Kushneria aurantia]|uniref:AEC family transporter n=1 Tax=Kushneria aurantia TaxID=504092 RepID=A0ABV6G6R8_9GAMM|nr:AEC family transporter [Kushneria aurantia]
MDPLAIFATTFNATAPVFSMVLLGVVLRRLKWIDADFIHTASMLVFRGAMPTLLFLALIDADMGEALQLDLMLYLAFATLASFALIWLWASRRVAHDDRGVYVQAGFRGNGGILGLAVANSMYGSFGLSAGSMLVATLIPLYNALSVVVLARYQPGARAGWRSIARKVATNPLILAVIAGLAFAASGLQLPGWLHTSGEYFAGITLPLALISIGGTMSVAAIREASGVALGASLMKLVWVPLAFTALAALIGFGGRELVMLFIFLSSPSAAASFVMARAMGGNARLAANVIAVTTLCSSLTVTLGIFLLQLGGLA